MFISFFKSMSKTEMVIGFWNVPVYSYFFPVVENVWLNIEQDRVTGWGLKSLHAISKV